MAWRARTSPAGEWSDVHETTGAFVIFRVVDKPPEPWNGGTTITVDRVVVPYLDSLDPRHLITTAVDQMALTVVDPEWGDLVPEHYKYRMMPE